MKILAIHNFHRKGSASGDDQVFKNETELLERHGIEVIRYTVSNDDFDNLGVIGKIKLTLGMLWSFKNYKNVKRIIEKEKPDIVHIHTFFLCYHRLFYMRLKDQAVRLRQLYTIRVLYVRAPLH